MEFAQKHDQLNQIVRADPAVDSVGSFIVGGSNQGRMFIALKPLEVRKVDIFTVIARLRRQLARVEGVTLFMTAAQDLRVGGRSSKSTYQYTLTGSNLADLNHWSDALVAALQAVPHFQDVTSDLQAAGLQARVVVDRDAVSRLGLNMSAVDNTLYDAFGQRQVSVIYLPLSQHHVVLEASPRYQLDPASLDRIYVKSSQGRLVPLGAIARVERTNTALSVNHQGQFPRGDNLLQPRRGLFAERRDPRDRRRGGADAHAQFHPRQLPGDRQGLPGFARHGAPAHPRGAPGGVHHPRHPL